MTVANEIALWFAIFNGTICLVSMAYWLRRREPTFVFTALGSGALLLMALRDLLPATWALPLLVLAWLTLVAQVPFVGILLARKYRPRA